MAKRHRRSNREAKKPKTKPAKAKAAVAAPLFPTAKTIAGRLGSR